MEPVVPVVIEREVVCASDPCTLWKVIGDTERMNRAVGMKKIEVSALDDATAARFLVKTRLDGWGVEYEELPFEWVENEYFVVRRQMRKGPLHRLEMTFRLKPQPDGRTLVSLQLVLLPRFSALNPIARMGGKRSLARFARELLREDAQRQLGKLGHALVTSSANGAVLVRAAERLRAGVTAELLPLADRLIAFIKEGSDHEVGRIRPFQLADQWQVERTPLLSTCLAAVIAGLLELNWELICPSCRTASSRTTTLAKVSGEGHCQLCDLSFGVELDRAIEGTFAPSPAVRVVDQGPYCIGGPARTPHVVAQALLAADRAGGAPASATLQVPDGAGRYRLFVRGGATASVEAVTSAPREVSVRVGEHVEPARIDVAGGGEIRVTLDGGDARHVKLERIEWASQAATVHHLSMNPLFRRLFSGELLKPGLCLKVTRVTLLFTDLTGSTALYARQGDAPAFRLVQDHFDLLGATIEAHGGVLVKTIGDAVMGAFLDEGEAIRAAIDMQRAWPAFLSRQTGDAPPDVHLKIGLFSGPTYAVTANGALDYFGQSVNVAARLQAEAEAGEVVLPEELAVRAADSGWLDGARISARFSATLKGLPAPVPAARLVVT